LLKRHLAETKAADKATLDVEVCGLRVGGFKLVTFPGEITAAESASTSKKPRRMPTHTSPATQTATSTTPPPRHQRRNTGYAQEDCDVLVAPEWQAIFETKAVEVLKRLSGL
jgi:hypothetical protein